MKKHERYSLMFGWPIHQPHLLLHLQGALWGFAETFELFQTSDRHSQIKKAETTASQSSWAQQEVCPSLFSSIGSDLLTIFSLGMILHFHTCWCCYTNMIMMDFFLPQSKIGGTTKALCNVVYNSRNILKSQ